MFIVVMLFMSGLGKGLIKIILTYLKTKNGLKILFK